MSATILPFPQSPKAVRRYSRAEGMMAAGLLSLLLLERDEEKYPPNVHRFDEPNGPQVPERSPEMLFALLLWAELPRKKQEHINQTLRGLIYCKHPEPSAVKLSNLLNRRGRT